MEASDFVVRIFQDVGFRLRNGGAATVLTYQKSEIRALGQARAILESMVERRRGFNVGKLQAGIKAIAEIRAGAVADGDAITVTVSASAAACLRECLPYYIEYEVLWQKDQADTGRRWRR